MTSQIRTYPAHSPASTLWRNVLLVAILLVIIAGAAWLALTPTTVTDTSGTVSRKWTEMSGPGQTTQYWIEISNGRQTRRCSIGGYQTQLVDEWQGLQAGSRADMTCYGQSAVSLMGYSR